MEAVAASAGGDVVPLVQFDGSSMAADFSAAIPPLDAPPVPDAPDPTEIAFVDWRVVGEDALTVQRDGMLVVVLDANQDGIAQISEVLAQHQGVKAVHILAHGDAGEMFLGNSVLDQQAVAEGRVASWGSALTQDGDVLLYGCNVAEGSEGQTFVQQLAAATGADVGASTDATGNAAQGGNWSLEYTVGALEASPLSVQAIDGLLATFTGTSGADSFTSGNTGSDIYNFTNANLTSGDTITDASGTDDLRITDAAAVVDSDFTLITGIDRLVFGNFTNSVTIGALGIAAAQTGAGGLLNIVGGTGTDTLSFANFGSDLDFAFNNDGSVDVSIGGTARFHVTGVENFVGGSGNDDFVFASGTSGTLAIDGGAGSDKLDYSARTADTTVDLNVHKNIETAIAGSGTNNTLTGSDGASNLFAFQTNGDVVVSGLTAKGFNLVEGGAGASTDNTFRFAAGGAFAGSITGNGLTNTLDYSLRTSGATVNLDTGIVSGVSGTVSNDISAVIGSSHNDTITDGGAGKTYTDTGGSDTYNFGEDWGAGNTLTDSSGNNTISFATASTGATFQFNSSTTLSVTETGNTLTASGAFGGIVGSGGGDIFLARAGVVVNSTVSGGDGDDTFKVEDFASDFHGAVDGGAHGSDGDIVDYTLRGGSLASSIDNTLDGFSGGLSHIEHVQHPYSIFDGINDFFTSLQDGIDATVGSVDLPLVGNLNSELSNFVNDIRDFLLGPVDDLLLVDYVAGSPGHPTDSTVKLIEDFLSVDFTSEIPGATTATFGLTLIGDPNDPDRAEFALILEGVIFHGDWDIDFNAALPGLGLGIEASGAFQLDLTYEVRLAFGFDFTVNKFYFDTDGADDITNTTFTPSDDDVEIKLKLAATVTDGATMEATLGFLKFQAEAYDNRDAKTLDDANVDSPYQDNSRFSGFFAEFGIDLRDPGSDVDNLSWATADGRLTNTEFKDSHFKLSENLVAVMEAHADVDLIMTLDASLISAGLPSISFNLHYDQQFGEAEIKFNGHAEGSGVKPPDVVIEDLALNLGSFISDFLEPILDEVRKYTEPLQPVIDFLKADIPILSDIDLLKNLLNKDGVGGVDMLDFAGTILGPTKYGAVVTAVDALVNLIDMVNHMPTDAGGIVINFGTYTFGGSGNDLRDAGSQMALPNTSGYNSSQNVGNKTNGHNETKSFLDKLKRDTEGGGFSVPILTEPSEILKLLTGRTANLVMYDLPALHFDFNFHKSVPLVFPLNMVIDAGFDVTIKIGFGFDSSGILDALNDNFNHPEYIFRGFYIDDHGIEGSGNDGDEIHVNAHFSVGASVGISGIIEAGVEGGITGSFGFDFNDVDHNGALAGGYDGRIHFDELVLMLSQQGPLGFLNMHGTLDWFLQAFVWVGLDLGFFGKITLYDETFDLGGGNIVTFENHYNIAITPDVAHVDGSGNLFLHMGSRANMRDDGASAGYSEIDGNADESFNVDLSADGQYYEVTYNGTTERFAKSSVTNIIGDGAGGKDTLTIGKGAQVDPTTFVALSANVVFDGGDDDDRITYLGTGTSFLSGGNGNDRITANAIAHADASRLTVPGQTPKFDTRLEGGAGNDQITVTKVDPASADGNAYVHGGDGNDKIKTRGGNDVIFGGDESVPMTGGKANGDIIDAGAGNDFIDGGTGSDSIKGGDGNDTIYGGDEIVNIVRNGDGSINVGASTGLTTVGKALGDTLDGGAGDDTIYGGKGFDTIRGSDGNDNIFGGDGDDAITGGKGVDQVRGDGANFVGDASAATRTGQDTISWAVGEGDDSLVDGGLDTDSVILTGANADTIISLTGSGANVVTAWGANTLTMVSLEKFALNAGTGKDTITINDLAATTAKDISIGLGIQTTDVDVYDTNNDNVYHAQPDPVRDGSGHLVTTTVGGLQQLTYPGGTSMTDVLQPMRDSEGKIIYTVDGTGKQTPVYDDGVTGVKSKVERRTVLDSQNDQVTIYGSGIDDRFTLSSTPGTGPAGGTYSIQRQNFTNPAAPVNLYSISVAQGTFPSDDLILNALGGNDVIDASAVTTGVAELFLNGGANNDRVIGSQLADVIDSGTGNDTVSGNAGIDLFTDASGNDTLSEIRDSNFDLSDDTLKIGANIATTTEVETVSMFENFSLKGGAAANTLTVHDFNDGKVAVLDGAGGGDTYSIQFASTGTSSIIENDTGGTAGLADAMYIIGTAGVDNFESKALTATSGTIAAVNSGNRQTVQYNTTESLEVHGGAGADVFTIADTAMIINFYGEADADEFNIGQVVSTTMLHDIWLDASGNVVAANTPGALHYDDVEIAADMTNGVTYKAFFWGGDGNDYFEVNHNLAEIFLNGEADNDRFVINAHLTSDQHSNIAGGGGSNRIEYVQNAKVFIDGGTGFDVVVINGTSIADTFIITVVTEDLIDLNGNFILDGAGHHVQGQVQKVVGAGLQIGKIANVERLEINGAGGNDQIHVFATLPGMDLIVNGGSGDDTIYLAGTGLSVTGATPAHWDQPPTVPARDDPPYIDHYDPITIDFAPYYYWDWSDWPFFFYYDPPPFTIYIPVVVDPAPVAAYTPPKVFVPAAPYTFTQGDVHDLTGITGTFTINGDSGNDTIVADNTGGANTTAAHTGTLSQVDIVDGTTTTSYTSLDGFGVASGERINITGTETFNLNLGAFDDQLTVSRNDAGMTTTVDLGNGNNTVNLQAATGNFNVIGGTGNDTLNMGSLAPSVTNAGAGTLANITGAVTFVAGGGNDTLNLDNDGNATSGITTITGSSISSTSIFGGVSNYTGVETLLINLGGGADTVNVQSTSATITTINANGGDDVFNVSSNGATLTGTLDGVVGTLNLNAGANNNTLNVSDAGDTDADTGIVITSSAITGLAPATINYSVSGGGRFTGGVNIWAGSGNDGVSITSTTALDVTTFYANGGDDVVTVSNLTGGTNRFLSIHGDAGNDTIDASAITALDFTVLLYGDSGGDTYGAADKQFLVLTSAVSTNPTVGGTDILRGGAGRAILIGGTGGDTLTSKDSNDVLIGDNGSVQLTAGVVTQFNSTDTNGGTDIITAAGGRNLIIGGVGGDTITALTGTDDVVFGDNGMATFTTAGVILTAVSADLGFGGNDSINVGAGNNVVLGGAGGDTITTLGGTDVVIGDNGSATWTGGILTQFKSTDTVAGTGGDDTINVGDGRNYVIGGVGVDNTTAGTGDDVVLGDNGIVNFAAITGIITDATVTEIGLGGGEILNVGAGNNVVLGGAGGDTITALGGTDVVIGDNGSATWTGGIVTQIRSSDTTAGTGGNDTINVGDGRNYVIGGVGVDNTTAGTGDDVVLGDNGIVNFAAITGIITDATVTEIGLGGGEILNVGAGNNVVLGGAGGDTITALGGTDVVIGDSGSVTWVGGIVTQIRSSDTVAGTGGDDTINVGDGRNYVIGGVGVDNTNAGTGDDVVLGDNGVVNFTTLGVITDAAVTEIGLGGGEILNVGAGNNVVLGGAGGDIITTLGGTDVVIGDNGSATWTGGILTQFKSTDTVAGTGGDDTINVGDGRNYVIGGVGVDNTTAGTGDDVVLGDNGIVNFAAVTGIITDATSTEIGLGGGETLNVGAGNNVVIGGAGGDTITALGGTDVAIGDNGLATWASGILTLFRSTDIAAGTGGNDTIGVGDGNNYAIGGVGSDGVTSGAGDDVVFGDNAAAFFTAGGGISSVLSTETSLGAADTLDVGGGNNVVLAGAGGDSLTAGGGNDVLIGDNGSAFWTGGVLTQIQSADIVAGTGGNDTITAGGGRNYVIGGVGADGITAGAGDDVVMGDNGIVNFTTAGVITDATVTDIGLGGVDTIDVDAGDNVVLAGAGGDTVTALGGTDVVIGDNGQATWTAGVLTQFKSTDTVAGTGGNDTITVGEGDNYVIGGVGVDGITAGTGNDVVLGDSGEVNFTALGVITDATVTAEGAGGVDTIDVSSGDNVVLAGDGGDSVTALDGQDVVIGDNGQATWVGGVLTQFRSNNTGAGGNDTINVGTAAGVAGKNFVIGGVGLDAITGGQNDDVVLGDNGIVNFTTAGVITDATVTEIGTGDVDTIDVRGGNNVVLAGAGGDTVTALGGTDVVIGDNGLATWTGGVLTQFKSTDTTAGTGGNDILNVGEGRNYVIGGVGSDSIGSGTGDDVVLGDNGMVNFTAAGVITDATVTEIGLGGIDTINAGEGSNVVAGGAAGDTITTGAGNDTILGDSGNLTFTAGVLTNAVTTDTTQATGGNDVIAAGDGVNVVLGGVGNDTITTGSGNDVIIGDNGIAQFNGAGALLLVDARDPLLAGDDNIDSGAGDDVVIGGSGKDSIFGGTGNDVLIGDAGTATFRAGSLSQVIGDSAFGDVDFINGGAGNDILLGGFGDDTLVANLTDDLFTGGNARISFSGGLVTNIELIDGVDLVLQALFDSFSAPKDQGDVVIQKNDLDAGEEGGRNGAPILGSFGTEGIFASDGTAILPGLNSLTFSFGRGVPLSQIPELLRNIVLEMSLGTGVTAPGHGGESGAPDGGQQGGGNPPAGGDAQAGETIGQGPQPASFAVEAEATTLVPAGQANAQDGALDSPVVLAAGAAALTGMRPAQVVRTVQAFDPATGQLAQRDAAAAPAGTAVLERAGFAPRGIDW